MTNTNYSCLRQISIFMTLLICLTMVDCFNQRVMCYSNQLLLSSTYMNFWTLLYRDSSLSALTNEMYAYEQYSRLYNYPITNISTYPKYETTGIPMSACSNFIMNNMSCCPVYRIQNFTNSINKLYNKILQNTNYPILQYLYNVTNKLNGNSCVHNSMIAISLDMQNTYKKYSSLIQALLDDERKFINQTACLFCLGTKDFYNFIFPDMKFQDSLAFANSIMYERTYFMNRVSSLTSILTQLQSLHSIMIAKITSISASISTQTQICQSIKSETSNIAFLNAKRICTNETDCRKIAIKYFGLMVTPHISYYIKRKSLEIGTGDSFSSYVISEEPNVGFRGNTTYISQYGRKYLPNVTIYEEPEYIGLA